MKVNISTDAAYSFKNKIGAYAFIITSKKGKIERSGIFKDEIKTSNESEIKSIINAVFVTLKNIDYISEIVISTDSKFAIKVLNKKTSLRKDSEFKRYRRLFLKVIAEKLITIDKIKFIHTKAHTGNKDQLSMKNEWCDNKAKEEILNFNK